MFWVYVSYSWCPWKEISMFARIKKSGRYEYLQIVENRRVGAKSVQHVIAIGRMDQLQARGRIVTLVRSPRRFSEKVLWFSQAKPMWVLLQRRSVRLWSLKGCGKNWGSGRPSGLFWADTRLEFDVERAIFLTVIHRLFLSGSDRSCNKWCRDYGIEGVDDLSLPQRWWVAARSRKTREQAMKPSYGSPPSKKNAEIGFVNLKITERPQKVWYPENLERFPP